MPNRMTANRGYEPLGARLRLIPRRMTANRGYEPLGEYPLRNERSARGFA